MGESADTHARPLPAYPVLSLRAFHRPAAAHEPVHSLLDVGRPTLLASARAGIAQALRLAGIGAGHEVLLPAYCCEAVTHAVRWSGAVPVPYRIHENTDIDLDDARTRVTSRTRALLAVHYFGFLQPLDALRELADERNLVLIEDAAQALFGTSDGRAVGTVGDFSVGSLTKFYPVADGGCLTSRHAEPRALRLRWAGPVFELKSVATPLERATDQGALRALAPGFALARWLRSLARRRPMRHGDETEAQPPLEDVDFDTRAADRRISLWSRVIVSRVDRAYIAARRRAIYQRLVAELRTMSGCRVLLPALPASIVPYVVPLLLDDHERVYLELRRRGVPVFRWDRVPPEPCTVARRYSRELVQLACHQDLDGERLERIVTDLRAALRS